MNKQASECTQVLPLASYYFTWAYQECGVRIKVVNYFSLLSGYSRNPVKVPVQKPRNWVRNPG